jgi:uncharacterized protein (TIGR02246 family)
MLRTTIAALVTTSGLCGLLAMAASPAPDVTSEIVALERQVMDGWLKGNPEPMLARMDPQVTYIHEITGTRLEGLAAVRQLCEPYRGRPLFDRYEIEAPKVRTTGTGNVAVLSYQLVTHNGATTARWNMTQVNERASDGAWRVIHMHASQTTASPTIQ